MNKGRFGKRLSSLSGYSKEIEMGNSFFLRKCSFLPGFDTIKSIVGIVTEHCPSVIWDIDYTNDGGLLFIFEIEMSFSELTFVIPTDMCCMMFAAISSNDTLVGLVDDPEAIVNLAKWLAGIIYDIPSDGMRLPPKNYWKK